MLDLITFGAILIGVTFTFMALWTIWMLLIDVAQYLFKLIKEKTDGYK